MKKIISVILGIIIALLMLETLLQLLSISLKIQKNISNTSVSAVQKGSLKNKSHIVIMCIGESTTDRQYPRQLAGILRADTKKEYTVIDAGKGGKRTAYFLQNIDALLSKYQPDIVVSMLGINDDNKLVIDMAGKPFLGRFRVYKLIKLLSGHINAADARLYKTNLEISKLIIKGQEKLKDLPMVQEYKTKPEPIDFYYGKGWNVYEHIKVLEGLLYYHPYNHYLLRDLSRFYQFAYVMEAIKERQNNPGYSPIKRQEVYDKTQNMLNFLIENDFNSFDYSYIVETFLTAGDTGKAKAVILQVLDKNKDKHANIELYRVLLNFKLFDLAEKAIDGSNMLGFLAVNAYEKGNYTYGDELFSRYDSFFKENYSKLMAKNYLEIIDKIKSKGITMICMQYPLRTIGLLQTMLKPSKWYDEINFASNEMNFKNALKHTPYTHIFKDQFATDFGHCTEIGNTMIAENLSNLIKQLCEN